MTKGIGILAATVVLVGGVYFFDVKPDQAQTIEAEQTNTQAEQQQPVTKEKSEPKMMVDADTTYTVSEDSTMTWAAARIVGNSHVGTVAISDGALYQKDGAFVAGEFTIDMNTITESKNNEGFLGHITGEAFFNIEQFPTSRIELSSFEKQADGSYLVAGNLTILGQTHEITFPAQISENGDQLQTTAAFQIDRTKWGITYESGSLLQSLGDRAIKDEINFELDLTLNKS